jgi:hypothetical protein
MFCHVPVVPDTPCREDLNQNHTCSAIRSVPFCKQKYQNSGQTRLEILARASQGAAGAPAGRCPARGATGSCQDPPLCTLLPLCCAPVHAARPLPRRTRHECAHESPRDADLRPVPSRGTTSRSAPAWSAFKCPNLRSRPPRAGGRPRKYASSQALRKIGETGTARAAALAARRTGYEPLHPRAGAPAAVIPHWRSRKSSRLPREAVSLRRSRSRAAPECPVRVGSRAGTRGIRAKPQFMPLDQFRDVLGALASPHAAGRLRCMGCKLGGG